MHYIQPARIDLVRLHELNSDRYPYLLESVAHGSRHARYDILFAFPQQRLCLSAESSLEKPAGIDGDDFLSAFEQWYQRDKKACLTNNELPFHGGWFVYLAYELVNEIEKDITPAHFNQPQTLAYAVRCPAAIIYDHQLEAIIYFAEDDQSDLLMELKNDVANLTLLLEPTVTPGILLDIMYEEEPRQYLQAVKKIKDYIIEGDVFQVNLSRLWKTRVKSDSKAIDIYRNLRINNPAPFAGIAEIADATIISSSPERLVSVKNNVVETRPIAGTRPRSSRDREDKRLSEELLANSKEQAEHIMLIDLERNDLGRVCVPGSIHVDELMSLESYAHVHHIVSNVRGELRPNISPIDVIRAVFPGGTITGCPKVRCMQIIAELEQQSRGAYTGSMGYINLDGSMDLNILIRTLLLSANEITLRAGAGIVYDSDPGNELKETRAKARGLLRSLAVDV